MHAKAEYTRDKFLGGRIELLQPKTGFRAGTDTVLLAAAVQAQPHQKVLELGTGAGVALCCLGARVENLHLVGLELQQDMVEIAAQNLLANGLSGEIMHGDVLSPPPELKDYQFEHVLMNPPFFDKSASTSPQNNARAMAHLALGSIEPWVELAYKRLAPQGSLTIVHRASALSEILDALQNFGNIRILPIAPFAGSDAKNIVISAQKDRATPLRLLAPLFTRNADGSPSRELEAITRSGQSLANLFAKNS